MTAAAEEAEEAAAEEAEEEEEEPWDGVTTAGWGFPCSPTA